ncbi:S8/S53 family peptidase [Aquimarina sp. TRL1]|uniref:S8 family peptidase n=1 Tax=Aquimarina sp. (strain TRL1) TaxID=2736252 RepID=UPI00158E4453|nr:S8/S53 family peptidase [Aquimarina sp. TRL1]QKX05581.1 S8/S53 family peptidase [Aquimarina sp. TRL1]
MKKTPFIIICLFLIFSCTKEESNDIITSETEEQTEAKLLSIKEVNAYIAKELKTHGDVNWTEAPAHVLWSAVFHGDKVLSVGYGEEGQSFSEVKSPALNQIKKDIYNVIYQHEGVEKSQLKMHEDKILNVMDVKVTSLETIVALKKEDHIRYLEPIGYASYLKQETQKSSFGCRKDNETINSNDYRVITPAAWVPWSYDKHNISQAWNHSTGAGITVGVIDTGISPNQNLLGSGFNDGASSGRTISKYGTFIDGAFWWSTNVDGPNDKCGHGTSMASAIASPRNSSNMPVGVAYNCNLVSYRGTEDVLLNDYHERKGVSDALTALGNKSDVKIISMSIGYPWSIGNVKDAVRYAYSKGKLIIAAGGTSTSFTNWFGVIFPANMSETVAVTGIKDNGYNRCDVCHDGNEIDFTIVMQRAANTSRTIPVLGFNNGTRKYSSGSSIATAATAGIAALVWARNPGMTRAQVLTKLKKAGEFYPNKNGDFGYGNIDALKAVQ